MDVVLKQFKISGWAFGICLCLLLGQLFQLQSKKSGHRHFLPSPFRRREPDFNFALRVAYHPISSSHLKVSYHLTARIIWP